MTYFLAAEGPNGYFIPSDVNELIWGSIAFGIVVVLFLWKGLPLVKKAMADRTAGIEADLEQARNERADAEAEAATLTGELGDAAAERERIVAEAREQATRVEADLVARAEADVSAAKERARIEIQAQRDQALSDLRASLAAQAQTAADAVVRQNLDDEQVQRDLIDDYISKVGTP